MALKNKRFASPLTPHEYYKQTDPLKSTIY